MSFTKIYFILFILAGLLGCLKLSFLDYILEINRLDNNPFNERGWRSDLKIAIYYYRKHRIIGLKLYIILYIAIYSIFFLPWILIMIFLCLCRFWELRYKIKLAY